MQTRDMAGGDGWAKNKLKKPGSKEASNGKEKEG